MCIRDRIIAVCYIVALILESLLLDKVVSVCFRHINIRKVILCKRIIAYSEVGLVYLCLLYTSRCV